MGNQTRLNVGRVISFFPKISSLVRESPTALKALCTSAISFSPRIASVINFHSIKKGISEVMKEASISLGMYKIFKSSLSNSIRFACTRNGKVCAKGFDGLVRWGKELTIVSLDFFSIGCRAIVKAKNALMVKTSSSLISSKAFTFLNVFAQLVSKYLSDQFSIETLSSPIEYK